MSALFASCGDDQTVRLWRPAPDSKTTILSPLRFTTPTKDSKKGNSSRRGAGASESGESSSNGHSGQNPFPWASSPNPTLISPIHSPIVQIAPQPQSSENETDEEELEDEDEDDDEDEEMEDD